MDMDINGYHGYMILIWIQLDSYIYIYMLYTYIYMDMIYQWIMDSYGPLPFRRSQ